ncbi:hypothetical protein GCWU000341_00144 [Oribacterium sp. oral taxon 078 str. F0262]|nr:hypothetical protein GCWU000341_00144 [Oribacterium sp. oral taxon 078 str. F0262]
MIFPIASSSFPKPFPGSFRVPLRIRFLLLLFLRSASLRFLNAFSSATSSCWLCLFLLLLFLSCCLPLLFLSLLSLLFSSVLFGFSKLFGFYGFSLPSACSACINSFLLHRLICRAVAP